MAMFTQLDDVTEIKTATMRLDGKRDKKRVHLVGVKADKKDIKLEPDKPGVVVPTLVAAYEDSRGSWTVDLLAKTKGNATVTAKVKGDAVASIAISVTDPLTLAPVNSEEGMLVRLLLAENTTPDETSYDASKAKKAMQWMRVVLANRLASKNPGEFRAPGAKTLTDIVKGKNQFEGFGDYPTIAAKQAARIANIVKIANDDNDKRQEPFAQFLQIAIDVAQSKTLIDDPCPKGTYAWRTTGHGAPSGGGFVTCGDPISGNQFYQLEK